MTAVKDQTLLCVNGRRELRWVRGRKTEGLSIFFGNLCIYGKFKMFDQAKLSWLVRRISEWNLFCILGYVSVFSLNHAGSEESTI